MSLEIRYADDLRDVQTLNLELFKKEQYEYDETYSLDWTFGELGIGYFKNRINGVDGCVLVAEFKGKIVGYLCDGLKVKNLVTNAGLLAELENMFVVGKVGSMGIGQGLIDEFFRRCHKKGVNKVKVTASSENVGAVKFYEKQGFAPYSMTLELNL